LNRIRFNLGSIIGSPFSNMSRLNKLVIYNGNIKVIPKGSLKIGSNSKEKRFDISINANQIDGTSFEPGTFMDSSFENLDVTLDLSRNYIKHLEENVFLPFLMRRIGNKISDLSGNQLDCDDCRSAWICKSSTPDRVRKAIHDFECDDGRKITDCEKSFLKCK
jgi:hypothetical protein